MKSSILILLILIPFSIKSQDSFNLPNGDWIIHKVETEDGIELFNKQGFRRIKIKSSNSIDIYYRRIFDENDLTFENYRYQITGNKIIINANPDIEFTIEKVANNGFELTNHNQIYYFRKLLIERKKNKFDYKVIDINEDTVHFNYAPHFNGDFFNFFSLNYDTKYSFVVESSFKLSSNGKIDSITINSPIQDSTIISITRKLIEKSENKWKPSTTYLNDKIDSDVKILILFKSKQLKPAREFGYADLCISILNKAKEAEISSNVRESVNFYSDYISMYKFMIHNEELLGKYVLTTLVEDLNKALLQRAALLISLGENSKACTDLNSIMGNIRDVEEASRYLQSYCN